MAYNFPDTPTDGQVFETWTWSAAKGAWVSTSGGGGGGGGGASVSTSSTPPAGAVDGDLWWKDDTGVMYIYYDDGTSAQWVAAGAPSTVAGSVIAIKVFTVSGDYVPSSNMTTCVVECWGGGGGGGAVQGVVGATQIGGGGGGGGYSRSTLTAATVGASKSIAIGAGGASPFGNGGAGGATTFGGALVIANGGSGGLATQFSTSGTAGGVAGTGDLAVPGPNASAAAGNGTTALTVGVGSSGGTTAVGSGGGGGRSAGSAGHATPATGYGSGGGGGCSVNAAVNSNGSVGMPGLVVITEYGATGAVTGASSGVLRSYLAGLTLSYVDGSVFGIAAGQAADSTNSAMITLTNAITKTHMGPWTAGSGNGAMDTGVIPAAGWVHVFLLRNPATGATDTCISAGLAPSGGPVAAGFTQYRRIGSMKTATSQWVAFTQTGDLFMWDTPVTDFNLTNPGAAAVLRTISTPTGVRTRAQMFLASTISSASDSAGAIYVSDPSLADVAPSINAAQSIEFYFQVVGAAGGGQVQCMTNTASQIRMRLQFSLASTVIRGGATGWIDTRGRDD